VAQATPLLGPCAADVVGNSSMKRSRSSR
jgi:hypothetical protein